MTVTTARKQPRMHSQRQQEFFRRLDRALATRYVHEYLGLQRERRSRIAPNDNQTPLLWQPRLQVSDDPQSTRISATLELPGLQKEDLSIDREGDRLIVSGERRSPVPEDSALAAARYPIQEFKYGKYRRVINLSPGTQASTLSFTLKDGLLIVTWPRTPAVPAVSPTLERNRIEQQRSPAHG